MTEPAATVTVRELERNTVHEVLVGILCGAAMWFGIRVAQRLEDPCSEPRLTLDAMVRDLRGGDHA